MKCYKCDYENIEDSKFCSCCGSKLTLIEEYPLLNGRYKVVEVIGSGGMSTVLKAKDEKEGILYAIKEMSCDFKKQSDRIYAVQKFKDEAFILSRVNHPSIPEVKDYFVENDKYYLVMEFIDGKTLEDLALKHSKKTLSEDMIKNIILQICETLEYLHDRDTPIIHRDLKPSNFLFEEKTGRVVLIDFGIAKKIVEEKTGTLIGTPGYMAPEQYRGRIDNRTDIFGLGATIHYIITGENPASKSTPEFIPITKVRPDLSGHLEMILRKTLESDPKKRFQSAAELKKAIISKDYINQFTPSEKTISKPAETPGLIPGYLNLFDKKGEVTKQKKGRHGSSKSPKIKTEGLTRVQLRSTSARDNIRALLQDSVGIDIGTNNIKILQMDIDNKFFMYPAKVIAVPTPYGLLKKGVIENPQKMADILNQVLKNCNITAETAIVSIPKEESHFKICHTKEMHPAKIKKSIPRIAEKCFPFYSKDTVVDYDPLYSYIPSDAGKLKLLMAGTKDDVYRSLKETVRACGMNFMRIRFQPFLINQAINLIASENLKSKGFIVLDIGASHTDISIVKGGYLWFSKTLSAGGNNLTLDISNRLGLEFKKAEALKKKHLDLNLSTSATETEFIMLALATELIKKILNEVKKIQEEIKIKYEIIEPLSIFLCGGTSLMRNLDKYIENSMRVRCFTFKMPVSNEVDTNKDAVSEIAPALMSAFSLAMNKIIDEEGEEINLKKKSQKEVKKSLRDILNYKIF